MIETVFFAEGALVTIDRPAGPPKAVSGIG